MKHVLLTALAGVLLLALAGGAPAAGPAIHVEDAWVRAMPPGADMTAAYMTLRNTGAAPDRLVAVTCATVRAAELHTVKREDGMMKMRQVTGGIDVPAGGTVRLEPGGYHVMLIGPEEPIAEGDTVTLVLEFERAGRLTLTVTARRAAPDAS